MKTQKIKYPFTRKTSHVDNYFGNEIADPYRWLEETDSAETKAWVDEQNKVTNDYLCTIPFRDKIRNRLKAIWDYPRYTIPFKAGEKYFYLKNEGLQNQPVLYVQNRIDGEPSVFLDPNTLSGDGIVALKETIPSGDNKYLACSVSSKGSDWEEIFVMDIETGKRLSDHIKWVKFSGPDWYKNGFFYGSYEMAGYESENEYTIKNEFHKIYYHTLGTPQSDDKIIYEDKTNAHRAHTIWASEDENYLVLRIYEYDKKGNAIYYKKAGEKDFIPISVDLDYNNWWLGNIGSTAYLVTTQGAPNKKIITFDLDNPTGKPETLINEKEINMNSISLFNDRLIVSFMEDVVEKFYNYSLEGNLISEIKMPGRGCAYGFYGKINQRKLFYVYNSTINPPEFYLYDLDTDETKLFRRSEAKFNPAGYEFKQVFYTSKDGTRIPMFIAHKKGIKLDGKNPTYLYGYGGFNISEFPYFSVARTILLESGFVLALPNLRGGNEYGEKWHEAGMMFNKQNVFDDFIAAAEYMISENYTNPQKLGIGGGSNGALLVGSMANQRPDLFKIGFPSCGTMDMLRYQHFTIGASWVPELGSSDDPEQFKYILAYSPLHNIRESIEYPALMVITADHDDRVVPSHSYKYVATLQEKNKSANPVLIRVEKDAGHGAGIPLEKAIEECTDSWAFLMYNLGVEPSQ